MLYLIMISNLLVFGFRSTCYEKAVKVTQKWNQYLRLRLEKKKVRKGIKMCECISVDIGSFWLFLEKKNKQEKIIKTYIRWT